MNKKPQNPPTQLPPRLCQLVNHPQEVTLQVVTSSTSKLLEVHPHPDDVDVLQGAIPLPDGEAEGQIEIVAV